MRISKTEQLNALFLKWYDEQKEEKDFETQTKSKSKPNIQIFYFDKDGIVDEETYHAQPLKVLFISNESNRAEHTQADDFDHCADRRTYFNAYFDSGVDVDRSKLRERTCCLYNVLANEQYDPSHKAAKCFAFMNLNKRGGGEQIGNHLYKYCGLYEKNIFAEIQIIDPDIILWCGCNSFDVLTNPKKLKAPGVEVELRHLQFERVGTHRALVCGEKVIPMKTVINSANKQSKRNTHNSAKNIEKYHQLCTFEKTLTVSSMKEKNCLVESVATFLACKLLRIKVNFHIGIQKGERFASHAWTELADMEEKAYLRRVYDLML